MANFLLPNLPSHPSRRYTTTARTTVDRVARHSYRIVSPSRKHAYMCTAYQVYHTSMRWAHNHGNELVAKHSLSLIYEGKVYIAAG